MIRKKEKRKCINCGEYGSHFVSPSTGDPGFFMCQPKDKCHTCSGSKMIESSTSGKAFYGQPDFIPCPTCSDD